MANVLRILVLIVLGSTPNGAGSTYNNNGVAVMYLFNYTKILMALFGPTIPTLYLALAGFH